MIFGDVWNWEKDRELYPEAMVKAIDFIRKIDFDHTQNGRIEIDGEDMYAGISEADTVYRYDFAFVGETHEKYVDIHFCISGGEAVTFSRRSSEDVIIEDRLEKEDALLYSKTSDEMKLIMTPGRFAVFFPDDIHLAGYRADSLKIKKAVVKIKTSLFYWS